MPDIFNVRQRLLDADRYGRTLMSTPPMRPVNAHDFKEEGPGEDEYHSDIGWSQYERVSACHGSPALAILAPKQPSGAAANLGLRAHHAAAYWLIHGRAPLGMSPDIENAVRPYVYTIWKNLPKRHTGFCYLVESRVSAPSVHPDCTGTVDCMIWHDDTKVLDIHDLKHGKWPVSAVMNPQLMGYAGTAMLHYHLKPKRVRLWIHQVRLSKDPEVFEIDPMDIEMFMDEAAGHFAAVDKQKAILKKTKDPKKLDLHAGDHCRYCPAALVCEEREGAAKREAIELLVPKPEDLPEVSGRVIKFAMKVLPWAKNILKLARDHALRGGAVPGAKMVAGKRARVYSSPQDILEILTGERDFGGLGLSAGAVTTQPKVMSPNQVRELLPEASRADFDKLWRWQEGAPALVDEDHKKPALKVRPEDWFGVVGEDEDEAI